MDGSEYSETQTQPTRNALPQLTVEGLINPSNCGDVLLGLRRGEAERQRGSAGGRISTWAATVVIACLALGFLGSMIHSLSQELGRQQNVAHGFRVDADAAQGQSEETGRLLADPQTQLVHLTSASHLASDASIAWNGARHDGALFCDNLPVLPASQAYEIWAIGRADQGEKVVEIRPAPGVSVYPFHYSDALERLSRFEITAGSRDAVKPPVLMGALQ